MFIKKDYLEKQARVRKIVGLSVFAIVGAVLVYVIGFRNVKTSSMGDLDDLKPVSAPDQNRQAQKTASKAAPKKEPRKVMDIPTLINTCKDAIVMVYAKDANGRTFSQGTGFFINKKGHVVSNYHVLESAHSAEVKTKTHTYKLLKVLGESKRYDVILFTVDLKGTKITAIPFASQPPQMGEKIVVIGNPLGLDSTASDGIVSAKRTMDPYGDVIQITSPISPGSSGSPVLNMKGEAIGVATFQSTRGQNLNFAMPIARVKELTRHTAKDLAEVSVMDSDMLTNLEDDFARGKKLYEMGQFDGAIKYFRAALSRNPVNAEAHYYIGLCKLGKSDLDALQSFKTALDINPQYAEAYTALGKTYIALNMPKKAISALNDALQVKPEDPEAMAFLGIAYTQDKEYRAGISYLKKSVDLKPTAELSYYLGLCYMNTKQYSAAVRRLLDSLKQDSQYIPSYITLAGVYLRLKNYSAGVRLLNEAVILEPNSAEVHFLLGLMHLGTDNIASAAYQQQVLRELRTNDSRKYSSELGSAISRYKRYKEFRYKY